MLASALLLVLSAAPNPYLDQARLLYESTEYEKCVQRTDQASRWENSPAELVQIEIYAGLCQFLMGKTRDAIERFEVALRLDPSAQLPELTNPKVVAQFERLAAKAKARAPAPKDAPVVAPALTPGPSPVTVIDMPPPRAPSRALSITLASVAVASAGGGAWFGVRARQLERAGNGEPFQDDSFKLSKEAASSATIANLGFGLAAAAATSAILAYALADR
jgi:hypothetical protein